MRNYFKYIAILALGIVSCEPELDNPIDEAGSYTNGEADFSNYVALEIRLLPGMQMDLFISPVRKIRTQTFSLLNLH